ncbi:GntR family transcriptional regulator [Heyndrickxia sp. NPDC080065]|uniref:GntR family transcriptional regulator n=1 Tax=Heyndrickxia sp. NPDC080065 TaxID=3390568 RepID=UPI003D0239D8
MTEEFLASKPIYMQIAERVYQQIVRGELKAGDKLPSVREMAIQSGVNPNTIQRTYGEMERVGIVETKRGQGTFVTENQEILTQLKVRMQIEIIQLFVKSMKDLGFSNTEILAGLEEFLRRENGDY